MAEGDTLVNSTKSVPDYVDALVSQKRDLRVALTLAIIMLRSLSEDSYPFLMDSLELRTSMFADFADLKIWFNEKKKERGEAGFGMFRKMMGGGE